MSSKALLKIGDFETLYTCYYNPAVHPSVNHLIDLCSKTKGEVPLMLVLPKWPNFKESLPLVRVGSGQHKSAEVVTQADFDHWVRSLFVGFRNVHLAFPVDDPAAH